MLGSWMAQGAGKGMRVESVFQKRLTPSLAPRQGENEISIDLARQDLKKSLKYSNR
jgi:hypothetical protein